MEHSSSIENGRLDIQNDDSSKVEGTPSNNNEETKVCIISCEQSCSIGMHAHILISVLTSRSLMQPPTAAISAFHRSMAVFQINPGAG